MIGPARSPVRRRVTALAAVVLLAGAVAVDVTRAAPLAGEEFGLAGVMTHLVISEVVTGGTSASDEFVEVYNPGPLDLSLDGVELVYVTASGTTITRKAAWGAGAVVAPGAHLLVANAAGVFAAVADVTYANGLAATGGSLALRAIGDGTAIDTVGWGTAASSWLEITPAPAPVAGQSLERLPGGAQGSTQDTDHNFVDFVIRSAPEPQNSASPPVPSGSPVPSPTVEPSGEPTPEPTPTGSPTSTGSPAPTTDPGTPLPETPTPAPTPTPVPTPDLTPSPTPEPLTVAQARALPDGSTVLVAGTALTDGAFTEGGGYLADGSGGIAVLISGGTFERGAQLAAWGIVDDRYAQRTLRVDAADITILGPGADPASVELDTGTVGEAQEGQLVRIGGAIQGAPTLLSSGLAFDLDDGSGSARVVVGPQAGIDTVSWVPGAQVDLVGVLGQRDASGTGTEGYRVQPRDAADIGAVLPPPTPEPTPTATPTDTPTPTASPTPNPTASPIAPPLVAIADARQAEVGTRLRIRGVVTFPTGLLDQSSAVVADPSGAILVRLGTDAGRLRRGQLVELVGTRSTKAGMASLRVAVPALILGTQAEPVAVPHSTGRIGEAEEAVVVVVRGLVGDGPRRSSSGTVTFTVDDGSGPIRVWAAAATGITARHAPAGAWVEVRAVVGQQTTGAEPTRGYRLWPRDRADLWVLARPVVGGAVTGGSGGDGGPADTASAAPDPAPPPPQQPPRLTAETARATPFIAPDDAGPVTPDPVGPIRLPLAAGLAGLAGLLALGWRHGTLARLAAGARSEIARRRAAEDESYTPPP